MNSKTVTKFWPMENAPTIKMPLLNVFLKTTIILSLLMKELLESLTITNKPKEEDWNISPMENGEQFATKTSAKPKPAWSANKWDSNQEIFSEEQLNPEVSMFARTIWVRTSVDKTPNQLLEKSKDAREMNTQSNNVKLKESMTATTNLTLL